jgi:hypothetical protein
MNQIKRSAARSTGTVGDRLHSDPLDLLMTMRRILQAGGLG